MEFNYDQAVHGLLIGSMIFLSITICFCLLRAVMGPKLTDRVVSVNMIGVKTMLLIVITGVFAGELYFVDVALVFALLSFLAVVVLTQLVLQFKTKKAQRRKQ